MESDPGSDDVLVPLYDKSLREGRGDRADPAKWTRAQGENSAKFYDFPFFVAIALICENFNKTFHIKFISVIKSILLSRISE
jgi:hypothetical protein